MTFKAIPHLSKNIGNKQAKAKAPLVGHIGEAIKDLTKEWEEDEKSA